MESASSSSRGRAARSVFRARTALALLAVVALGAILARAAPGAVYYGKQDALEAAFPDADEIEAKRFFLTEEQREQIQNLAGAPLEDRLLTLHVGKKADKILGYAFLETHEVRTMPETLLIVVSPDGGIAKILLAAFYEPPEYEAPKRWLEQFDRAKLTPGLRVNRDIKGIAGSTLTAHAVTSGIRRVLAMYQILILDQATKESE